MTGSKLSPEPEKQEELGIELVDQTVVLKLPWQGGTVTRGYRPPKGVPRQSLKEITVVGNRASDDRVPQGVTLHYLAQGPKGQMKRAKIAIPHKELGKLVAPSIEVDKTNYSLDILDGGVSVRRYPIALGGDPKNRKYCQDMASTPEGWYRVYNLQPQATYYRALDIDYPRPVDHIRHQLAIELKLMESSRPIGGEIQIHGKGIEWDWTAGCMALRDEDMDQLFSNPAIKAGMAVFIAGSQLRPQDKEWLRAPPPESVAAVQKKLKEAGYYSGTIDGQLGDGTALALGRYQGKNGLEMSCQLDGPSREHFKL